MPDVAPQPAAGRKRRSRWRRIRRWGIRVLVFYVVASLFFGLVWTGWLSRLLVVAPSALRHVNPADDPSAESLAAFGVDHALRVNVGPPKASISVWVVDPPAGVQVKGTIFVLHGWLAWKQTLLGYAKHFAKHGYRAVVVDLRGHGRSTGNHVTWGVAEAHDLSQVLDALEAQHLATGPVGAFGHSYGAGLAIKFAAADPRVRAVTSVSPFASLREIVPVNVHRFGPVFGWVMSNRAIQKQITLAGQREHFDPDEASPLRAIGRTTARVLILASRDDWRIPSRQAEELHAAAQDHSELKLCDGVGHVGIVAGKSGEHVRADAIQWFDRWLKE